MTQNEVRRHFEKQILILFNKNGIRCYLKVPRTIYIVKAFLFILVTDT